MNIYFDYLLMKTKRHRRILEILVLVAAIAGGFFGFFQAKKSAVISPSEQKQIDSYQEKLVNYQLAVDDSKTAFLAQEKAVCDMQSYVDRSILMRIDPQNVKCASVQYVIAYNDGVNVGNINQSILAYILGGEITDAAGVPESLEPRYWNEVVSAVINANVLCVTVNHYDPEKSKAIIEIIKERLNKKASEIALVQGAFVLKEQGTSVFEKSDSTIISTQNNFLNVLRNDYAVKVDMENRLTATVDSLEQFVADNRPAALDKQPVSYIKNTLIFAIAGALGVLVLFCAVIIAKMLFSDTIHSEDELEQIGISVLSVSRDKKFIPELSLALLDIDLLISQKDLKGVHIQVLSESSQETGEAGDIISAFNNGERLCSIGVGVFDKAEDLKNAIHLGCCVPVLKRGEDTLSDLCCLKERCQRFDIRIPGCILI